MQKREDKLYQRVGIYAIKDKVTDNMYIGQATVSFGDRRDCHFALLRHNNHWVKEIQNAWNRSDGKDIEFIILHDKQDGEDFDELERYYIKLYREKGNAVNFGNGGSEGAFQGKHISKEAKRKIGEKNRQNMLGKKFSEETKANMSKAQKERCSKYTEEEKRKMTEAMNNAIRGVKWTEERKQQYREAQKTNPHGSQFTIDTVHEIRRLHEEEKLGFTEIANRLNMNRGTVYNIGTYKRWKYA